jgi:hypothetical protein
LDKALVVSKCKQSKLPKETLALLRKEGSEQLFRTTRIIFRVQPGASFNKTIVGSEMVFRTRTEEVLVWPTKAICSRTKLHQILGKAFQVSLNKHRRCSATTKAPRSYKTWPQTCPCRATSLPKYLRATSTLIKSNSTAPKE